MCHVVMTGVDVGSTSLAMLLCAPVVYLFFVLCVHVGGFDGEVELCNAVCELW